MNTITIGKKEIKIYTSIDELPIKRYQKFNKLLLVDSGIGSDMNDVNHHIAKIQAYIKKDNKENATKQLENMRMSLYLISEEINVRYLSYMTLIKSVDGVEVTDLSDDNLKVLYTIFEDETKGFFDQAVEAIKKKIESELNIYFPGKFEDPTVKEYHDKLKSKAYLILKNIIGRQDHEKSIEEIDNFLLLMAKPENFKGSKSREVLMDKEFVEMNLYLLKETGIDAESIHTTVLKYFQAFEYLKKKNKPKNKK